uniref:CHCH domain-containing protein n=1 Tax=Meleagris gallopavo TaxID=9103 RepID=A0A803XLV5_MELGA
MGPLRLCGGRTGPVGLREERKWGLWAEDPALPHSPIVQRIREDCAEPFVAFEQCLKENQESVLKCSEHVNAFLRCAERVKLPA